MGFIAFAIAFVFGVAMGLVLAAAILSSWSL